MKITKDLRKELILKANKIQYCKFKNKLIEFVMDKEDINEDVVYEMYKESQQGVSNKEWVFNIRLYKSVLKILQIHKIKEV